MIGTILALLTDTLWRGAEGILLKRSFQCQEENEMSVSVGERLKEERERLGYNQTDFVRIAGVTLQSQGNYESGRREPSTSYFAAIAAAGADVQYIITGVRCSAVAAGLTREEVEILEGYRQADTTGRTAMRAVMRAVRPAAEDSSRDQLGVLDKKAG